MPAQLAFLFCTAFVVLLFWSERNQKTRFSKACILPIIWYLITASRPFGVWLSIIGVPLPVGSGDPTEGSIVDRGFYGALGMAGILVLQKRRVSWTFILRENKWLMILLLTMVTSLLWSNYPLVSFKRTIMLTCAIIMALVVLTEENPRAAIAEIIRRSGYILIPFSILLIRYFRAIGVNWSWSGESVSWIGVATTKNTLGQLAAVVAISCIWERKLTISNQKVETNRINRPLHFLVFLMSLYLLKGSDDAFSLTSIAVFLIGLLIFYVLGKQKSSLPRIRSFIGLSFSFSLLFILIILIHAVSPFSEHSLMGALITTLGRDITLTGRTEIWHDVLAIASHNPILGTGFGAFWIGREVNIPWTLKLTWTLNQAHNGYLDTYLQLGWVGLGLLFTLIFSSVLKIGRAFSQDFEYGRFRFLFFLVILFINNTESTLLRGGHHLWFLFLICILSVPVGNYKNRFQN